MSAVAVRTAGFRRNGSAVGRSIPAESGTTNDFAVCPRPVCKEFCGTGFPPVKNRARMAVPRQTDTQFRTAPPTPGRCRLIVCLRGGRLAVAGPAERNGGVPALARASPTFELAGRTK